MSDYMPKWHKELVIFSKIKPLLIVEGNILDLYQYPENGNICRLPHYLFYLLQQLGYGTIAFFDSMQGFYNPVDDTHVERLA